MRYFDAFTGIASATHAFHRLGWECAGFSEIDKFPSAVLAHRYPGVKNYGDITKYREWNRNELGPIDALCGGSPCQAFSVAGLGKGISDPRGELMLTYGALAAYLRPPRVIWENVPGVLSSNGGRDFASFLALLTGRAVSVPSSGWKNSGIVGGIPEAYGIAWASLDAQFFGVPQRRERVFVVGYLGDWRRAAAVLFESESLLGYPPPSREKGETVAGTLASRTSAGGGLGTDLDLDGGIQEVDLYENHPQDSRITGPLETAGTVNAKYGTGGGNTPLVAGTLQSGGKAAGSATQQDAESGLLIAETLRGHPRPGSNSMGATVFSMMPKNSGKDFKAREVEVTQSLMAAGPGLGDQGGDVVLMEVAMTLNAKGGSGRMDGESETMLPVAATRENPDSGPDGIGVKEGTAYTLEARSEVQAIAWSEELTPHEGISGTVTRGGDGGRHAGVFQPQVGVRRLMPVECERLQGLPDNWTLINNYNGKWAKDGPRYKAIGNSMAEPVMFWIGSSIERVEKEPNNVQ